MITHITSFFPYNDNGRTRCRIILQKGREGMSFNRNSVKGLLFTAFAAGIIFTQCFPVKVTLFILATMLVILGITSCRR